MAGAGAGAMVAILLPVSHKLLEVGVGVMAAGASVVAFGAAAYVLGDADSRAILRWLRQSARLRSPRPSLGQALDWWSDRPLEPDRHRARSPG